MSGVAGEGPFVKLTVILRIDKDRSLLVLLASRVQDWKNALLIVKPEMLLRWHRQGFYLFWSAKSKGQARQPRISEKTITLIKQMAADNRRWGTKRIRGALQKLGIQVNKGTVRYYMWQVRRKLPPQHHGQSWATFLANHASQIWAYDFGYLPRTLRIIHREHFLSIQ
jgi:putative transposase